MDVILLNDVEKLGLRGDVVAVARGYARNYLLPRKLAELATPARVAELRKVEAQRAQHEAHSAVHAEEIAGVLSKTVLRFDVKAGPTGSLFGSVTATDVADEIWRVRKVRVDRRKIELEPIKRIGRYAVTIDLFAGVGVDVKTLVVPEGGELPPEEELEAMAAAEAAAAETAASEHAEAESTIAEALAEADAEPELAEGEALDQADEEPEPAQDEVPAEGPAEPHAEHLAATDDVPAETEPEPDAAVDDVSAEPSED